MNTVTLIANTQLIIGHDWRYIYAALPVADWNAALPDHPIEQRVSGIWPELKFAMRHPEPVSIFTDTDAIGRPRVSLTGMGLLRTAISLKGAATSFDVEDLLDRIFGPYSTANADAEDFLCGLVPYLAREAGTLDGSVPGDCSDQRGYLPTAPERDIWGPFWEAMFGPAGCNGQMPESWHRWRANCLAMMNLSVEPSAE